MVNLWIRSTARQIGERAGGLAVLALVAGTGLMIVGKRPFAELLLTGLIASAIGLLAGWVTRLNEDRERTQGMIVFYGVMLILAMGMMAAARMGWGHLVGRAAL